jgi:8-oxo-dGTP diphosphatase
LKHYLIIVECAIECNNKFLIIQRPEGKHAGGLLSFAGGKVEEQDELDSFDILRAAVKREILEELGLTLNDQLKYVTSEYFVDSFGICAINNLFHYQFDTMPTVIPCQREVPWFGWMTREEINTAPNSPIWLKKLINLV